MSLSYEKRIKSIFSRSGLVHAETIDIPRIIKNARPHISRDLTGEAILTVGGSLTEVVTHSCGVIAIGPFGCMPNRISEAILGERMTAERKRETDPTNKSLRAALMQIDDLPFLAIETDGSTFPQLIHANPEAFLLRANRFHEQIVASHFDQECRVFRLMKKRPLSIKGDVGDTAWKCGNRIGVDKSRLRVEPYHIL